MHGPKVEQFIKNHSLGQRSFMHSRKAKRDNSASATNTQVEAKRAQSTNNYGMQTLHLRKYNDIDF